MRFASLLLILVGLTLCGYLLYRSEKLAEDDASGNVCQLVFDADCDNALQSEWAKVFGAPLASWGLAYYSMLLGLFLLQTGLGEGTRAVSAVSALILSLLGGMAALTLLIAMTTGVAPSCPICVCVHLVTLVSIPVFKRSAKKSWREILSEVWTLVQSSERFSELASLRVLAIFGVALIGAIVLQWGWIQELRHAPKAYDVAKSVASVAMTSRIRIPIDESDPQRGEADAQVEVVVFSDLQCKGCQRFAAELQAIATEYPGELRIVFKHFPLGTDCNPAISKDRHPRACYAAKLAECARRQGRFWEFHDAVYATDLTHDEKTLHGIITKLGLDQSRLDADMDAASAKLKSDIQLALKLGVDETPTVFVNGRRAPDLRDRTVRFLVMAELAGQSYIEMDEPSDTEDLQPKSEATIE